VIKVIGDSNGDDDGESKQWQTVGVRNKVVSLVVRAKINWEAKE
jgi:hypothetical protein